MAWSFGCIKTQHVFRHPKQPLVYSCSFFLFNVMHVMQHQRRPDTTLLCLSIPFIEHVKEYMGHISQPSELRVL